MRKWIVLVVLTAASCGDKQYEAEESPPPDTAGGRPDLSRPDAGARVLVTLSDTGISFSHDSIPMEGTGQTTFAVVNKDSTTRTFKIDGDKLGEWSSPIPAGQTIMMSMLLSRGSYEMLWPEDGKGQKKTFRVY
jgi:hypothetical protein